jgi:acyl-CoA reductase-like NAD-dependent aldehyde dehydrogenase
VNAAFEAHYRRVLGYAEIARADGPTVLTGGRRLESLVGVTMLQRRPYAWATRTTACVRRRSSGPLATCVVFVDVADAIRLANQSRFGLVAYVWSQDVNRIMRVSEAVRAGTVLMRVPS